MAYVPQQISEDEKNQFANPNPTTPFPQGSGSSGSGAQPAPGMASSTQFGSNAAKLSDYLNANKEQVGEFGNQVAGNLTQGYNAAMGAVDTGFGNFNQDVSKGYTPINQDVVGQAAANPTEFVKNPDNVSQFKSQYNNQYKGPENFENSNYYKDANNQVNKAVENAGLTNSFSGLGSYLRNFMGGANQTQGMQTLNTALLQRSPEASSAIKTAAEPYKNLTGYLGDKTAQANSAVSQAKDVANQSQVAAHNQIDPKSSAFQSDINSRLQTMQNQAINEAQAREDFIGGGGKISLSPEQLARLGISQQQSNDVASGLNSVYSGPNPAPWNLSDYFTGEANPGSVNLSNAANPEDFAYSQALAQLTGSPSLLNQNEANLSGTAPVDTNVDIEKLLATIKDHLNRFPNDPGGTGGFHAL